MAARWRTCTQPGCPTLVPAGAGRCAACERAADARRGGARQRGYGTAHERWRRQVLARDGLCVLCGARATDADHYPLSRRELVAAGLDPADPAYGRALCHSCHSRATAVHQPGGWAAR